jgi:hypothetical protein
MAYGCKMRPGFRGLSCQDMFAAQAGTFAPRPRTKAGIHRENVEEVHDE